jgi:hypothetical protein
MAAPAYVPKPKIDTARTYESPPRRPEPWLADRPAELTGVQPQGPRLGYQGPDQGYVLRLVRAFDDTLVLTPGEHRADVVAGCAAVATKRASLFGRAPTIHDLTVAFTVWGYLSEADAELVRLRRPLFEEVHHPHHNMALRRIVDLVPIAVLRLSHQEVARIAATDWKSFFKRKSA